MKLVIVFCWLPFLGFAQESWNSLGFDVLNTSGSVSVSMGQAYFTPIANSNFVVFQGVQIPYLQTDLSINQWLETNVELFPNPVQTDLHLTSSSIFQVSSIWDISGRIITEFPKSESTLFSFSVSHLADGTYFILLNQSGTTFSIPFIKN